jgi:hypothetical protein
MPNPASAEIIRLWDRMNTIPTYELGRKALMLWLNSGFAALEDGYVGTANFKVKIPIQLEHVLEDSWIAYERRDRTKLRIWNGVLRKVEDPTMFLRILSSHFFQSQSITAENPDEPSCLSVFGMKATKGILTCQPMLLESTDSKGISHKIVCQKRHQKFANYMRISAIRKSQRTSNQETKREANEEDDWELIYSQSGAISGFHLDSSGSGRFLHQILGVKVLCACPCSPKNWQAFQPYYKNMNDLCE